MRLFNISLQKHLYCVFVYPLHYVNFEPYQILGKTIKITMNRIMVGKSVLKHCACNQCNQEIIRKQSDE